MKDAAYQGAPGAFSEEAAQRFAGGDAQLLSCREFRDAFAAVRDGLAGSAVVPIENTLAGSIHANFDLLAEFDVKIAAETTLQISHNLIAAQDVRFEDIRDVHSHPVALAQCENFFRRHPHLKAIPVYDTAGAVEMVIREGRKDAAAIASHRAADVHGGNVLVGDIQDQTENYTRFLLLKSRVDHGTRAGEGPVKTTILFKAGNRPGGLFECLRPFAELNVDLIKLESRPIRNEPFKYLFYADLVGDAADSPLSEALSRLRGMDAFVRVLGSYRALGD